MDENSYKYAGQTKHGRRSSLIVGIKWLTHRRSYSQDLRDVRSHEAPLAPDRRWLHGSRGEQAAVELPGDVATPLYVK
jgi:hypothetical protein